METLKESIPKRVYYDVSSAITWSPLIRLNNIGKELECELWGKCEYLLPGGSVKDRIGKRMIVDAEKTGRIKPGDTLIEPTSGNTGIGLSLNAAIKGYNMIITLPQKMSQEKVAVLEGLGASIIRTPTEAAWDSAESHIGVANKLVKELPNAHILDQYGNPSNPLAHYEETAEEILQQCDGKVDMVVLTAGTGGTITGIARKIKERLPKCKIIGVDPVGSILAGPGPIHSYKVEGIGYDFIPDVLDTSIVDEWVKTEDTESFIMARRLIREEGMLCGGSSGSCLVAALQKAKELKAGQRCVVIIADSVRNYMSKFLDKRWMYDWGFLPSPPTSKLAGYTVSDLALEKPLTLSSLSTCADALHYIQTHHLSVAPICSEEKGLIGAVSEETLMVYLANDGTNLSDFASKAFLPEIREIDEKTELDQLRYILIKETVAFVVKIHDDNKKKELIGIVTKLNLLSFLGKK